MCKVVRYIAYHIVFSRARSCFLFSYFIFCKWKTSVIITDCIINNQEISKGWITQITRKPTKSYSRNVSIPINVPSNYNSSRMEYLENSLKMDIPSFIPVPDYKHGYLSNVSWWTPIKGVRASTCSVAGHVVIWASRGHLGGGCLTNWRTPSPTPLLTCCMYLQEKYINIWAVVGAWGGSIVI